MHEPLVSILMNCFNGEKYLRQAIDSVLAQSYGNWEIIFWDNQSTDGSAEIFTSYRDSRLKYFYAPEHTRLYEARNCAMEKASGELIAFLDVDDWWMANKLEKQVPLFQDPDVGLVCGNFWVVNERNGRRWISLKEPAPTGRVLNELLQTYFVGLLTLVVRREALRSLAYPCDARYHMIGDLDLVVRLAVHWKLDCEQSPVGFYRAHDGNESLKHQGLHLTELECWLAEMKEVAAIRSCPGFSALQRSSLYQQAMHRLLQADKKGAYSRLRELPWGKPKLRLLIALLLPMFIIRKTKN